MFHHNCHYWHFSLKLHLTLSRLKGDEALFSDILNHFTDLLDKNRAALPSSLLLKSQKAAISFTQKCQGFFSFFFLLMHTTPYMLDVKCAGKTNRLVGKELRQQHTVTSSFIVIQGSPKSWSQKNKNGMWHNGMWKADTMWDPSNFFQMWKRLSFLSSFAAAILQPMHSANQYQNQSIVCVFGKYPSKVTASLI